MGFVGARDRDRAVSGDVHQRQRRVHGVQRDERERRVGQVGRIGHGRSFQGAHRSQAGYGPERARAASARLRSAV